MNKAYEYINEIERQITEIKNCEAGNIESAAALCAECLGGGGMIYAFGTGHSHMLAEELFYRAGGLARIYPILDEPLMLHRAAKRSSEVERLHGYAETILDDIDCIKTGDVMFIFSNSGRNAVTVDMALGAKKRGMKTICITNLAHSESVASRHESGKKLYEVCDVIIDNHGVKGDAAVKVGQKMVGPASTVTGAMILEAVVCRITEIIRAAGGEAEIFLSSNSDDGDEINLGYIKKYKSAVRCL